MAAPVAINELSAAGSLSAGAVVVVYQGNDTVRTTPAAFITEAESFTQSGTGAIAEPVQDDLRQRPILPEQFGCLGNGTTDDYTNLLKAFVAAVAQNKPVDLRGKTYLVGTALALDSTYSGLKLIGAGGTIKKGFSGNLLTLTNTANFCARGVTFEGQHGTFTGKGVVFSGSSSDYPVFIDCVFSQFTDTDLEFGANAGHSAAVIGCRSRLGSGQTDPRSVHINGPDTGARIRRFVGCSFEGYIQLDGAFDTYVTASQFTRIVPNSACDAYFVSSCRWGNGGTAMTLSGNGLVVGNSFAGSVTLDANFQGVFEGNIQSTGTFTNNTTAGVAYVVHHEPAATVELLGRHKLRITSVADMIQYSRTVSMGDADATLTPGGSAPMARWANTLTADRTVTLSDTAADGDRFLVTRSGSGAFNGFVKRANTFLLANILQNGWAIFEHDGTDWNCIASGQITGGNKALWSTTTTGNVGGGTDDLISLTLWAGAIGNLIGDAFGVSRGVRIKAWGSTANNANAKTVTLVAGGSTILTTALTANQASTWEIEATILATGDNAQKYTSRMLQGGATAITDLENGTLTLTDANSIAIKCTAAATNDNDIVQEGMTIEFIN